MRRRNAAKKRKLNSSDKTKSTDTEDESTFGDEGIYWTLWSSFKSLECKFDFFRVFLDSKTKKKREGSFWVAEKRFRYWIRHTVRTQWFYWFVIVLVFLNTITVAAEHDDQPEFLTNFLCTILTFIHFQFAQFIRVFLVFRVYGVCLPWTVHVRNVP